MKIMSSNKAALVLELITPLLFSSIILLVRFSTKPPMVIDRVVSYLPLPVRATNYSNFGNMTRSIIYTPNNNDRLRQMMSVIYKDMNFTTPILEFDNYLDMYTYMDQVDFPPLAALAFEGMTSDSALPKRLNVTITFPAELRNAPPFTRVKNWITDLLYPLFQSSGPRNILMPDGGSPPGYYREHFVALQAAISESFMAVMFNVSRDDLPLLYIRRFPDPKIRIDPLLEVLKLLMPLIFFLSYLYPCISTVKMITIEKEQQLKEAMNIMGLPSYLHWIAWLLNVMLFMTVAIVLTLVMFCISWSNGVAVFTYSDPTVLWFFLTVYTLSVTTFCFLMSSMFEKANTAASVTGFFWFLFLVPYFMTYVNYTSLSYWQKVLICLFHNTGMSYSFLLVLTKEGNSVGLRWNNLFEPVSIDDDFSVGIITVMMGVAAGLQMLLAVYIEKVKPGDFGVPKPWYYPISPLIDLFRGAEPEDQAPVTLQNTTYIEKTYETKQPGIEVRKLRKVFAENRVAVHELSLNMYPDEITVLLGENGAGKTTSMSMLIGMMLPTSGTAIMNGCDIRTEIDCVRSSVGFCPQHNILFDELTVREHIIFYSALKGLSGQQAREEVEKYVELLELADKANAKAKTLPGGMKRRLSVGVAFCGNSKVVLCDEPTSGMDPSARRALWDLLQQEKKNRTILLSTQFMDEADVLGDRVAIMKSGELICYGSAMYLKNMFASGYLLLVEKGPRLDVAKITSLISGFIPSVAVDRNVGTELTYRLKAEHVKLYEPLLKELEDRSVDLDILSYGIAQTSLEDVFMQIYSTQSAADTLAEDDYVLNQDIPESEFLPVAGSALVLSQLFAMLYKKFFHTYRNWILVLVQNFIPIAMTSLTVHIARMVKINTVLPPLEITLDTYTNTPMALVTDLLPPIDPRLLRTETNYQTLFSAARVPRALRYVSNVTEFVTQLPFPEYVAFKARVVVGLEMTNRFVTAWFNNQAFHSVPVSIALYHNALLKTFCADCHLRFINAPMRFTLDSRLEMQNNLNDFGFQLASHVGFAMSFVSAFYVIFYIRERVSRAKVLQLLSGANIFTYWVTSWLFDVAQFLLTTLLLMTTLLMYGEPGWNTADDLGRMFLLFLCFIWCILPFTYVSSFLVNVASTGLIWMIMFGALMGNAFFYMVYAFEFPSLNMGHHGNTLTWLMMSVPHFAIIHGLKNLDKMNTYIPICEEACRRYDTCLQPLDLCHSNLTFAHHCCILDYFHWKSPGIGRNMFFLFVVGCVLYVLLFLVEFQVPQRLFYAVRGVQRPVLEERDETLMDSDVLEERNRIKTMSYTQISGYNLVLRDMTKFYDKFLAVNRLSLAVEATECFGLLGINGAGKTTTFKMLIGDEHIDDGEAWVRGYSLAADMRQVYQNIGYCPQFDALFDELTGRETLKLYCLLRGIPLAHIKYVSLKLASELQFLKHLDKRASQYSGGNKRKLSTALALIGNPAVVYLDEPTTGMDPGAKRGLWAVLSNYRQKGKTIILTSHSMEECDALCTRLAIMVNGEFQCIGSRQRLKNKFAKSYLLVILMSHDVRYLLTSNAIDVMMTVREFVEYQFDGASLKENYQGRLTFHLPMRGMKWSTMFGIMEQHKDSLQIENYSLSQATLEEVFLSFTKYQKDVAK